MPARLKRAAIALAVLTAAGCATRPAAPPTAARPGQATAPRAPPSEAGVPPPACRAPGWEAVARANEASLPTLAWAPFGRPETGWAIYAPLIQHEIATPCPPGSAGFAAALARWQTDHGLRGDGVLGEPVFAALKAVLQGRRPFLALAMAGLCPEAPAQVDEIRPEEGLGKPVSLRPQALEAYRRMVAAARAETPEIAADPELLAIFSGFRDPEADAARCDAESNCDGVVRARCSAHRTGLALDLYLGHAEGFMADSTADPNRLYLVNTPAYRWLVANAARFGFVNYAFEPWHWEWTGEAP